MDKVKKVLQELYRENFDIIEIYKPSSTKYVELECKNCKKHIRKSVYHSKRGTLKCPSCHPSNIKPNKITYNTSLDKLEANNIKKQFLAKKSYIKEHNLYKIGSSSKIEKDEKKKLFIDKANFLHDNRYDYTRVIYKNVDTPVEIICKEHGSFTQTPYIHTNSPFPCPECAKNYYRNTKYTLDEIIEKFKKVHGEKYSYKYVKYSGIFNLVKIECPFHGMYEQTPKNHISGNGCPNCTGRVSKSSNKWLDSFENKNIIYEYSIPENKNLIVDGYDPTTNTVYQYHGDYWHGNPRKYNPNDINSHNGERFGELYKKTLENDNFLKSCGYQLIVKWEGE